MSTIVRHPLSAGLTAGLLAAVLGAAGVSAPAAAAPPDRNPDRASGTASCAIEQLPVPADVSDAGAEAIDPTGRFIAGTGWRLAGEEREPVVLLWDRLKVSAFVPPAGASTEVVDVNRDGVVVGNSYLDGANRPWRLRDGKIEVLPVVDPAASTYLRAINVAGDIVGAAYPPGGGAYPVLWPADQPGTVAVLTGPKNSGATDITANGTVVGTADDYGPTTAWMRTPGGQVRDLAVPGASFVTVAAAAGRWAVGVAAYPGRTVTLRWDLRTREATELDPALITVTDVNRHGTVVSDSTIVHDRVAAELPAGPWGVVGAKGIADNGTVAGFGRDLGAPSVAVRWKGC